MADLGSRRVVPALDASDDSTIDEVVGLVDEFVALEPRGAALGPMPKDAKSAEGEPPALLLNG